jgi:hypothetical protein
MLQRVLLVVLALSALLGCRDGSAQPGDLAQLLDACRADAAKRANCPVEQTQVTRILKVTWRDGSLGCPQPGMDYTMALIPGYRIAVKAGDQTYDYHTDLGGRFVCCEEGGQEPAAVAGEVAVPGGGTPTPGERKVGVLHMDALPDDPNGNSRLVLLAAGEQQVVIPRCTGFAAGSGGQVLARERTSRSSHSLWLTTIGREPKLLAQGFDFAGLAVSATDDRYAVLMRARIGDPFRICLGQAGGEPKPLEWAPTVRLAGPATLQLAGDVLVLSEPDPDGGPDKVAILDLAKETTKALETPRAQAVVLP